MSILPLFQNIFAPPRDLILIILAAWIGLTLSERGAPGHPVNLDALNNLLLASLGGFLIGGRLLYALENFPTFSQSPGSIFSLNTALFDQWGGLAIAVLAGLAYGRRAHLPLWDSLDVLTPLFAALAIGIALSHLASGAAFGKETNVPWAVEQWGALRHPTQLYETIAALVTLAVILIQKPAAGPGFEFLLFVALSSASRLVLEGFRGDSTLILGGLRAAQIAAWFILLGALIGLDQRGSPGQAKGARVRARSGK
ncbi:MAG TPA: prolipoprotein diacylglyceryl transferase family protein [Anaerolineales bacterium]|nr:prolipoprotein diacylglyceryl transferase family protein [Anaerolineales bacterium]